MNISPISLMNFGIPKRKRPEKRKNEPTSNINTTKKYSKKEALTYVYRVYNSVSNSLATNKALLSKYESATPRNEQLIEELKKACSDAEKSLEQLSKQLSLISNTPDNQEISITINIPGLDTYI
jgi:protein subunit release factor A